MIYTLPKVCWCGETHIHECDIHGHQEYCHDEGDGWYIFHCVKCEIVEYSWAEQLPKSYHETMHIRAMTVLAGVFFERYRETGLAHP